MSAARRGAAALAVLLASASAGCKLRGDGTCLEGLSACGEACVDLQSDVQSCGACGAACEAGQACAQGACAPRCDEGLSRCGLGAASSCVDLSSDAQDCGACGHACDGAESCAFGVCHLGCAGPGWGTCGDRCVRLADDGAHCGDCETACEEGEVCAAGACTPASEEPAPRLFVSLTADDTFSDQFTEMAPALEAYGLRGTFYVNAGRVDVPGAGYLTAEQLRALQRVGHEVGSHGLTHQHLVTSSILADRVSREVCDSRAALLARGLEVRSIAYPFGDVDGLAQAEARRCGYTTGRTVGTINGKYGRWSDASPPLDPFAVRATESVSSAASLAQVEQYVLDAEAHATGVTPSWLIVNFHHVCPGATCNPELAWDRALFREFVAWLAARAPQGTVVRTVSGVAGGALAPPVASGTPLVLDGDFESYRDGPDGNPECWTRGGSGDGSAAWSRVDGRSGFAQQLLLSGYRSGSRNLVQGRGSTHNPDFESCGTPVVPGRRYTFRCWYRSDVPVALTFYENDDATHLTSPWMTTPSSPPSPSGWAEKKFEVVIPAGLNTVFFGPYVSTVCTSGCLGGDRTATLVVDDCSATEDGG